MRDKLTRADDFTYDFAVTLDLTPYGRQEPWEDSPNGRRQGGPVVGRPVEEDDG